VQLAQDVRQHLRRLPEAPSLLQKVLDNPLHLGEELAQPLIREDSAVRSRQFQQPRPTDAPQGAKVAIQPAGVCEQPQRAGNAGRHSRLS